MVLASNSTPSPIPPRAGTNSICKSLQSSCIMSAAAASVVPPATATILFAVRRSFIQVTQARPISSLTQGDSSLSPGTTKTSSKSNVSLSCFSKTFNPEISFIKSSKARTKAVPSSVKVIPEEAT
ncbi:Uncharacterised protein [Streptococcus pneumoniae]|nr:Uncharacterised protein [Streptococcus pneumoniae]COG38612.1 Uncharacterised protein [Streptococcus pneumoniae]